MSVAQVEPKEGAIEDRAFWLEIRRAYITVIRAIDARYGLESGLKPLEFKQHGKGGKPNN